MRLLVCLLTFLFAVHTVSSQTPARSAAGKGEVNMQRPRLVVGIVVDQMRADYLERYGRNFSTGGFRRLVSEGFNFRETHYSYMPTFTAPGHACIFTGAPPSVNGIVSNDWYDNILCNAVYCVEDTAVRPVGTQSNSGKMSPRSLLSPTITDALKLATDLRSRVVGVALKDRAAILPAGHTGDAAYWHDPSTNNWVTSSYYMDTLPAWLQAYNGRKRADEFLSAPWKLLLPRSAYTGPDSARYEGLFSGETQPVFPHDLKAIRTSDAYLLRKTPFGNTYTMEVAIEAIRGERLGKGDVTDFITISFSSTDYIGHMYGIRALELEDAFIRLDRDLEKLLSFLDEWVGRGNALVFLTSDHGVADNVSYCIDHDIPAGSVPFKPVIDSLEATMTRLYGSGPWIVSGSGDGIYLNRRLLGERKINVANAQEACAGMLRTYPWIATVVTASKLDEGCQMEGVSAFVQRGYYRQRSPDITMVMQPGWMEFFRPTGTTHGSPYAYDTHVPLLFYGWHIPHGETSTPADVCDIAPTLARLLGIALPGSSTGHPLPALLK